MKIQTAERSTQGLNNGGAPTHVQSVVRASGLSKRYGDGPTAVDALRDVDIAFARGTFTAIMGPSGSGKSTLLHILAGLEHPSAGKVEVAGRDLAELSDRQLTPEEKKDIIAYVKSVTNGNNNPGGNPLGGFGPASEGVIAWVVGLGALIGITLWIGARA